jgi:DNA-binding MarR family transcriptional regulator
VPHRENVSSLVKEVTRVFRRLESIAGSLHGELGVTPAMRGVLEVLDESPATVPQIARARSVSRQHIQTLVDAMWERKLCRFTGNPAHARSPIVELTDKGRAVLETLRESEQALARALAAEVPGDVATALSVLRRLNAALLRRLPER